MSDAPLTDREIAEGLEICDAASNDWALGHQVNSADARTEDFVSVGSRRRRWSGTFADCLFAVTARTLLPRALRELQKARKANDPHAWKRAVPMPGYEQRINEQERPVLDQRQEVVETLVRKLLTLKDKPFFGLLMNQPLEHELRRQLDALAALDKGGSAK